MTTDFNLQKILQGDINQLRQLFEAASTTASAESVRINTFEKLFNFLLKDQQFDAAFMPHISKLKTVFCQHASALDVFYCDATHPLRMLMHCLITRGRTWYQRDSKASQQFLEKFCALFNESAIFLTSNNSSMRTQLSEFQQWLDSEDKRAALLESRLCETEINNLKAITAECKVLDLINSGIANKQLPTELISGFATVLKGELLHCYFTAGINSPLWKTWQRLLPLLGNVFTPDEMDEQQLYRNIPIMLSELERSTNFELSNAEFYRPWANQLSEYLMTAVKMQPVTCSRLTPLAYPEGHSDLTTRVPDAVLQQGDKIQQGDWVLFVNDNNTCIRCKLALKNAETDQLLFVDNIGRKVMIKSTKDFSVCLSTGIAKPLTAIDPEVIIIKLLQALVDLSKQKPVTKSVPKAVQENVPATEKPIVTSAPSSPNLVPEVRPAAQKTPIEAVTNDLNARKAAAQKALAEARELAEKKIAARAAEIEQALVAEREREQHANAQAAEYLQRIQLANIQISSLNLGARVEIIQHEEPIRCKLAVIIAATGKYIFSDNLGRKIAEFQREQLVQALLDNQLTLLNNGDSFDDQLAKVIRGLRKDVS